MELLHCPQLDRPWQLDGVWRLLRAADREFVPPLSERDSTVQSELDVDAPIPDQGPVSYFREMRRQSFLLAVEGEEVLGFLSFRPDYLPPPLAGEPGLAQARPVYITTLVVSPPLRRQGLARRFYRQLLALYGQTGHVLSTRTWSTNTGHIRLLESLGFTGPLTIPNDRGPGVDTVYYYRLS